MEQQSNSPVLKEELQKKIMDSNQYWFEFQSALGKLVEHMNTRDKQILDILYARENEEKKEKEQWLQKNLLDLSKKIEQLEEQIPEIFSQWGETQLKKEQEQTVNSLKNWLNERVTQWEQKWTDQLEKWNQQQKEQQVQWIQQLTKQQVQWIQQLTDQREAELKQRQEELEEYRKSLHGLQQQNEDLKRQLHSLKEQQKRQKQMDPEYERAWGLFDCYKRWEGKQRVCLSRLSDQNVFDFIYCCSSDDRIPYIFKALEEFIWDGKDTEGIQILDDIIDFCIRLQNLKGRRFQRQEVKEGDLYSGNSHKKQENAPAFGQIQQVLLQGVCDEDNRGAVFGNCRAFVEIAPI